MDREMNVMDSWNNKFYSSSWKYLYFMSFSKMWPDLKKIKKLPLTNEKYLLY